LHGCTEGSVLVDGQDVAGCSLSSIRRQIGYVQQHPKLFNTNVYENIIYGNNRSEWTVAKLDSLIKRVGVQPLFAGLPNGLHTKVGKGGSKVSGGQRQAIILLRMAIGDKKVLLLDEPTSALDKDSKKYVLKMLEHITASKTTFIVTHDRDVLPHVDRILKFKKGRIISDTSVVQKRPGAQ
jgi:ABC-type bacteriocin/lantibiotic exporter with double-glycine peptidase domain